MKKREFDKHKSLKEANKIEDINNRILFLKNERKEYKQQADSWDWDIDSFTEAMDEEIKYLEDYKKSNKTPQSKPIKPIWWQGTARQLGYLIEELARLKYIDHYTDINKVIKDHFINKDKKSFTDSISQNRSGVGINKSTKPRGHEGIDDTIKKLEDNK